jgi:cobalt-zinc-cadmium efflux system protein
MADHWHHHPNDLGARPPAFALAIALNLAFVVIEAGMGLAASSLALLADAGHNLSDVAALALAWTASWLGRRPPTRMRTYGYRRFSILASLANAALLMIAVGAIALEAVRRFAHPAPVAEPIVIAVAAIGVVLNASTALLFMAGRKHDLNLRGAFQHMAGDAAISLGVVLAALAMMATGWLWLDPAMGLFIAAAIVAGTWGLLRESMDLALDAVPSGIDPLAVERYLAGLPGITEVHDLHIWAMSTTETALTVHLIRPDHALDDEFLSDICRTLHDRFDIDHSTIQLECGNATGSCHLAPANVV